MTIYLLPNDEMKYRADIDGLRAVAVIFVVLFHYFPALFRGGYVGVDIFFVISGYLISSILINELKEGRLKLINFYKRRILRIFPSLLIVLMFSLCIGWIIFLPPDFKNFGKHLFASSIFLSNFIFWDESGYFDKAALTKPLLHLWSLAIEEQFYIFWPILIIFISTLKKKLLLITCIGVALSFFLNIYLIFIKLDFIAGFYSPFARIWELLIGALLAQTTIQGKISGNFTSFRYWKWTDIASIIGTLSIIAAGFLVSSSSPFPGIWALLPTIGAFMIIRAGSDALVNKKLLSLKPFVWLGLISYPLYLWHWAIISLSSTWVGQDSLGWEIRISLILLSIVLAYLTYIFIEKPIRKNTRKTFIIIFLASSILILGGVGGLIYKKNGFQSRFSSLFYYAVGESESRDDWSYDKCLLPLFKPQELANKPFSGCQDHEGKFIPNVYIWGDSHAAMIVSALKMHFGEKLNFIQRTATACAPFLDVGGYVTEKCKNLNLQTLEEIRKQKSNIVILMASWPWESMQRLSETILSLQKSGINNILVIGPIPRWKDELPKILFKYYKTHNFTMPPTYISFGLSRDFYVVDEKLRQLALQKQIQFISPTQLLCNEENQCITRAGNNSQIPISFDDAHLTAEGANYFVSKFPKNIFSLRN